MTYYSMASIIKIDQVMVAIAYYDEHKLHKDYGMVSAHCQFSSSLSRVWFFMTSWLVALKASLSITNSQSLLKLMSI